MKKQNQSKSGYLTLAILALAIVGLSYLLIAGPKIGSFTKLEDIEQPLEQPPIPVRAIEADTQEEIVERLENQLDPKAVNQAKLNEAREKIEKIRQHEDVEPPSPALLSSIAPPQPETPEIEYEHPSERLKRLGKDTSAQQANNTTPPNSMDIENPPTWNETLNEPTPPTEVPDPFTAPPMKVSPKRGQN